ncbi:MAG: hypothetical protein ABI072_06450, partial [Edaphobacter sp.]
MTYPLIAQSPQDRRGDNNSQARPDGQRGNSGRPTTGGNARPQAQPSRPNPGPQRPAARPNQSNPRATPRRSTGPRRASRPNRPAQWGRPPQHRPSYSFRPNDRSYLHRYYAGRLGRINRARRPRFLIGGYFPYTYIRYISPLPP